MDWSLGKSVSKGSRSFYFVGSEYFQNIKNWACGQLYANEN